jgi:hypothetical protein
MTVNVTLVDPDGQEWVTGSAIEANDLLARGYRLKGQGANRGRGVHPKPTNAPSNVANPAPVTTTGQVQPAAEGNSK